MNPQNGAIVSHYVKKFPKLYLIIFSVLFAALIFLLYNYITLSSDFREKMTKYELISESNELVIKLLADRELQVKDLNLRLAKNELMLEETRINAQNHEQTKSNLAQSVAEYEKKISAFNIEEKSLETQRLLREEYLKYQSELDEIQTKIYNKATISHSNILRQNQKNERKLIEEWLGKQIGLACFLSDVDGFSTQMFYRRCRDKGATITLYQSYYHRFGGYTSTSWEMTGDPIYKSDTESFLFSIDKEKKYLPTTSDKVILNSEDYFPSFGPKDILVSETATWSSFPQAYGHFTEDRKTNFFIQEEKFDLVRIEVYLIE